MKKLVAVMIAVAPIASPSFAAPQAAYAVVRPTDADLTCPVMADEINSLTAEVQSQRQRAQRDAQSRQQTERLGRGIMAGLARGANIFSYGSTSASAMTGVVAGSMAAGVATEMTNGAATPPPPLPEVDTPQQRRLTHLNEQYRARPC